MPKKSWVTVTLITALYWVTYEGYEGFRLFLHFSPLLKHAINFVLFFSVGIIGLASLKQKWIRNLWIMLYAGVSVVLILGGLLSISTLISNSNFNSFLSSLRLFFTSPLPYAIAILFAKSDIR
jgi:hypothetical protein